MIRDQKADPSADQNVGKTVTTSDPLRLQETRLRIENLLSSIPLGMVILTQDLRILSANHYFRELLEEGDSDLRGRYIDQILSSPDITETASQSLETRGSNSIEYESTRSDPKKFLQITMTTMKKLEEDEARLLLIAEDITHRKWVEEALRKNKEDLEETNRRIQENQIQLIQSEKMASIGQLAAGIAHEINNPIGFVLSNMGTMTQYIESIQRILKEYRDLSSVIRDQGQEDLLPRLARIEEMCEAEDLNYLLEDIQNLLQESINGTERVKDIVQNLKSFSHVDESETSEANVNDGIEDTLKIVWNELKYRCQVHKELGQVPSLRCYPGQLNQVFMNLLVNAAQSIPDRGEITISTTSTDQEIIVQIKDTGKGIPKENLNKLFTPFFTTKPVGKGTGLGLSISYGIVQKHKGSIEVESEVGKGTTFTVRLPLEGLGEEES